jgi:hypothetical protein
MLHQHTYPFAKYGGTGAVLGRGFLLNPEKWESDRLHHFDVQIVTAALHL